MRRMTGIAFPDKIQSGTYTWLKDLSFIKRISMFWAASFMLPLQAPWLVHMALVGGISDSGIIFVPFFKVSAEGSFIVILVVQA